MSTITLIPCPYCGKDYRHDHTWCVTEHASAEPSAFDLLTAADYLDSECALPTVANYLRLLSSKM